MIKPLRILLLLTIVLLPHGAIAVSAEVTREALELTAEQVTSPARPGELADLGVEIVYRSGMTQADYPDFIALEEDLRRWLATAAPSSTAERVPASRPWPVLLGELADRVLVDYAPVDQLKLTARPYATPTQPSPGAVMVTVERGAVARAARRVVIRRHGLQHQGPNVIDLVTTVHYRQGAAVARAPDGGALRRELIELMANYPTESDYWETLIKALGATLLERHEAFHSVALSLKVHPTASLTYPHSVFASLDRSTLEVIGVDEVASSGAAGP